MRQRSAMHACSPRCEIADRILRKYVDLELLERMVARRASGLDLELDDRRQNT
jgi:hypothetical protein